MVLIKAILNKLKLLFSLFFPNRIPFLIPLGTDPEDENNSSDDNNVGAINDADDVNDADEVSYDYGDYSTSLELNRTENGTPKSNLIPAIDSEQNEGGMQHISELIGKRICS